MKINNIKINAYGKLKDKEIDFSDSINVIKGNNESGKTTLLNYIVDMFYGNSKTKDGKEFSDYERFKPWKGDEFSGKLKYTLDNGKKIEIQREFKNKNTKLYNENMEDITSKYDMDKKEGSKFFFEQTNVNKATFLSTVVSTQQGVKLETKDQNALVQKITNIVNSGDDKVSYKSVVGNLQDKIRDEIGTSKTSQKPINILKRDLEEIDKQITKIEGYEDRKYSIEEEKEQYEDKIKEAKERKDILAKLYDAENKLGYKNQEIDMISANIKRNDEKLSELKENLDLLNKDKSDIEDELKENQNKIDKKTNEINHLEEQKSTKSETTVENGSKKWLISVFIGIIFAVICIINHLYLKKEFVSVISLIIAVIAFIGGFVLLAKAKNKLKSNIRKEQDNENNKIIELNKELEQLKSNNQEIKNRYDEIARQVAGIQGQLQLIEENNENYIKQKNLAESEIKEELEKEKSKILNEDQAQLEDFDYESGNLKEQIAEINENIHELENELNKIEAEEKMILPQLDALVVLREKEELIKEQINELNEYEEIINIAIDELKEAYEEIKGNITPKFSKRLSECVKEFSNGKYTNVTINDEKGMIVENENGEYVEIDKLSVGTIDQLYLSLRLSMIEDLSDEKLPIMLDETFAYFDETRLENAIENLAKTYKDHQILIFTCTEREKNALDKMKLNYKLIEM